MRGVCTLDKICIKNVRSLKDTGLVSLSPITLLVGENSSGKSTFLRTFPLLKQSISKRTNGPLLWAGDVDDYVDFGSFSETVTNGRKADLIEFQFEFQLQLNSRFPNMYRHLLTHPVRTTKNERSKSARILYSISIGHQDGREYVSNLKVCINKTIFEFELKPKRWSGIAKVDGETIFETNDSDRPDQIALRTGSPFISSDVFGFSLPSISSLLSDILDPLTPRDVSNEDYDYILYSYQSQLVDIMQWIGANLCQDIPLNRLSREINHTIPRELLDRHNILINTLTQGGAKQQFRQAAIFKLVFFYAAFSEIDDYLNTYFRQVHYIAPLRATAERYYRLRNLSIAEVDYQGKNLAIFLNGLTTVQLSNFQKWTQRYFGFKVEVQKDGGHLSVKVALNNSKTSVNLSDTGFGYSQILPIITQLWYLSDRGVSRREKAIPLVIAIEQPELHLHPALQAKLTGAFIAAIRLAERNGYHLQLILETHSETIVNYLGRSIATGAIQKEDVSVVLFEKEPETNLTKVRISNYDSDGFLENWPIGFFAPKE